MTKFVVKSKTIVELIDIVEADSPESAKQKVLSHTCDTGPIQYVNTEILVDSVEEVNNFYDIIKQIHPTIPDSYIDNIITLNLIK